MLEILKLLLMSRLFFLLLLTLGFQVSFRSLELTEHLLQFLLLASKSRS